jgi:uncharacterized protein Yka (UPF0111/DUF47 family)
MFAKEPNSDRVFQDLRQVAENAATSAREFLALVDKFDRPPERLRRLGDLRTRAESHAREAARRVHSSFTMPIRPEELVKLLTSLGNLPAAFEVAAARALARKPEFATLDSRLLAAALDRMALALVEIVSQMRVPKRRPRVDELIAEIRSETKEAERIEIRASASLLGAPRDILDALVWKDVYEVLVFAARLCKEAATTVQQVLVSHC